MDEHSTATKARTEARTYNASKPAKCAIHFYAVIGSINPYMPNIFNNLSGNKTNVCGAVDYIKHFRVPSKSYNA
jgi:hypothetical protein